MPGVFAWENKAPGKNLDTALKQLLTYSLALSNPPLDSDSPKQPFAESFLTKRSLRTKKQNMALVGFGAAETAVGTGSSWVGYILMTKPSGWTRRMKIHRSIDEPLRLDQNSDERWLDVTQGLITSWERGREKSTEEPQLATRALNGELVVLPWKGGFKLPKPDAKPKTTISKAVKYGVFNYLAMWQGLRGEDLDIDVDEEVSLTCMREKRTVIFTSSYVKYANSVESED